MDRNFSPMIGRKQIEERGERRRAYKQIFSDALLLRYGMWDMVGQVIQVYLLNLIYCLYEILAKFQVFLLQKK